MYFKTLAVLIVFFSFNTKGQSLDAPVLIWSQRSHVWSRLRGIHGSPDKFIGREDDPTGRLQSESEKNTHKYGVGIDEARDTVCWSDRDVNRMGVYCQEFNTTFRGGAPGAPTAVVEDVTQNIRGLAIDWHTGNIYYAGITSIVVAPSTGGQKNIFKVLFAADLFEPSGVAVDSMKNLVFWTDKKKIEKADLSGHSRQAIVTDVNRPMGITLDWREQEIFWVDRARGTLERAGYDGLVHQVVVEGLMDAQYIGLGLYYDKLFVTSDGLARIDVYRKDGSDRLVTYDVDVYVYYVTVAEPNRTRPPHECNTKQCSHICLNAGNMQGVCTCKTGYFLDVDQKSCLDRQPRYIYAAGEAVMSAEVTLTHVDPQTLGFRETPLASSLDKAQALAYHYGQQQVYYSDTDRDAIYRLNPDVTGSSTELTVNARHVEGLAVDWLAHHLYWTDGELGHLMVAEWDGRYHRQLLDLAGTRPTGLAVDAMAGYLFWTDRDAKIIQRAMLDGSQVFRVVEANVTSLQGVFSDPHSQRLYWVDSGIVNMVNYAGGNRMSLTEAPGRKLYDVIVYQDLTTWTDDDGLSFERTVSKEKLNIDGDLAQRTYTTLYDVIAYDPYLQPQRSGPCDINNGGCQQLCFPMITEDRSNCACAIGFTLNLDGATCDTAMDYSKFLLHLDPYHKQVYQMPVHAERDVTHGLHLPRMDFPMSVDYIVSSQRLYWLDRNQIKSCDISGSDEKVLLDAPADSTPLRLCVDPKYGYVYYTDGGRGTVSRVHSEGDRRLDLVSGVTDPGAVVVDHVEQFVYWTNGGDVEKMAADGSERAVVVTGLQAIAALAVPPGEGMLYFAERESGQIIAQNISTGENETLLSDESYEINTLAVSDLHVYFTAVRHKAIYRIDRYDGGTPVKVSQEVFARVTDLRVIQDAVPAVPPPGEGLNWIIIGSAIGAALLLALLILIAVLACRHRKRKQEGGQGGGSTRGSHNGGHDVDQEYAYMNNATLFDIRSHNDGINGGPRKGVAANGVAANGAATNGAAVNGGHNGSAGGGEGLDGDHTGFDPVTEQEEQIYAGVHPLTGAAGQSEAPAVAAMAAGAVATRQQGKGKNKKLKDKRKSTGASKRSSKDPDASTEFELSTGGNVATRIHRLANRLRNRLSTIRWSGSDKVTGEAEDVEQGPEDAPNPQLIGPERTDPLPTARRVDVPPALHHMPRGFAPASHCVPHPVRTTWGKAKHAQAQKQMPKAQDNAVQS